MKLDKQIPSFTLFLNYRKEKMKIKSRFCHIKKYFEIHPNLMKICN